MLWSLIRVLVFVALVAAATYGAMQLMEVSGGAIFEIAGYELALNPLQLVIAGLLFLLLAWLLITLVGFLIAGFRFLNGNETAMSRYFARSRERKGLSALSEGMLALAAGDGRVALSEAARAERYLNRPEMTRLLMAQAAEVAGDRKQAENSYKALLRHPRTRFVGIQGVLRQKLEAGDTDTALKLAERAFALRPGHDEVSSTLLRLQAEQENWRGARKTLAAKLRHGSLPRDLHKRRDAVLALSEARELLTQGNEPEAREAAIEANRLSPDLIPAAVMAARSYAQTGRERSAARAIRRAWEVQPHPDLAAAFAEIVPHEAPQARIKRFRMLTNIHPDHPETRMLLAELSIAAEDFPAARRALGDLVERDPTARVLTLMAAIERGAGGSDTVVRGWLTRALTASRGPQWICANCHQVQPEWMPVCPNCKSFDTFSWTTPPQSEVAMPRGTQMLPLIVGQIEDRAEEPGENSQKTPEAPPAEPPQDEAGITPQQEDTGEDIPVPPASPPEAERK